MGATAARTGHGTDGPARAWTPHDVVPLARAVEAVLLARVPEASRSGLLALISPVSAEVPHPRASYDALAPLEAGGEPVVAPPAPPADRDGG